MIISLRDPSSKCDSSGDNHASTSCRGEAGGRLQVSAKEVQEAPFTSQLDCKPAKQAVRGT